MSNQVRPKRVHRTTTDGHGRTASYNGVRAALGELIPGDPLALWLYKNGVLQPDTIGLSVSDYLSIDEALRPIFFIDSNTLRATADTLVIAFSSPLLNVGNLVGNSRKGLALYATGTSEAILIKAYRYFGLTYGSTYRQDFDGNTIINTPDIGAMEYV